MRTKLTPIADLSCAALDSKPITVDWQELAKVEDAYTVTEASICEKCGAAVVGCGGERHSDADYESECDGHIPEQEGPMMNYFYPVDLDDTEDAARKLADTCLCVVEVNGQTGLALTGGGMDLSWEICAAFIALDFLPPLHFCDLPGMAGRPRHAKDRRTVAACLHACEMAAGFAQRTAERIRSMVRLANKRARAEKKRAA
jgi:hypothetical protein